MKSELTPVSGCRKTLSIEIPEDTVETETSEIARAMARSAKVPGFRPGHIPLGIVRTRYRDEIARELGQRLIPKSFAEAVEEHKLTVVQHSEHVDGADPKQGQPLRFTVTFEVYPDLAISNYIGVPATEIVATVDDTEIEAQLKKLQDDNAELIPVEEERPIGTGDFVDISFRNVEGTGSSEGFPERATVEVGGATTLQEFNDHLIGARAGDEVTFSVEYRADYPAKLLAGRTVHYTIRAESIKRRQIPELTDEFAESLGKFQNLEELRSRIRQDMETHKRERARQERREALLKWLEQENTFDVPETLVEHQVQARMRKMARDLERQKIDPRRLDIDWVKLHEEQQRQAVSDVRGTLILDYIAGVEKLEASDADIDRELERIAQETEQPLPQVRDYLEKNSGIDRLKIEIQRRKTLDLIEERAAIKT